MKTTQEKIKIMQAHVDGKEIEKTIFGSPWERIEAPNWDWNDFDFRIKPEAKTIPLSMEDFLGGVWWIRGGERDASHLIIEIGNGSVRLGRGAEWHYDDTTFMQFQRSRDCITWTPCSKEATN